MEAAEIEQNCPIKAASTIFYGSDTKWKHIAMLIILLRKKIQIVVKG